MNPKLGQRNQTRLAAKGVNSGALSQARAVRRENRQLALEVMAGTKSVERRNLSVGQRAMEGGKRTDLTVNR